MKRTKKIALAALLLTSLIGAIAILSCANSLPSHSIMSGMSAGDFRYVQCTIDAWGDAGMPRFNDDARELISEIEVVETSDTASFLELCHACPSSTYDPACKSAPRAYACSFKWNSGTGPLGIFYKRVPLIVLGPYYPPASRGSLVIHETLHLLGGVGLEGVLIDPAHTDTRRWGPDGIENQAKGLCRN